MVRSLLVSLLASLSIVMVGTAEQGRPFAQREAAGRTEVPPDYGIGGVRAYLYYELTGTFSPSDLLQLPPGSLWNTHAGGGVAKQPSTATLVVVEIVGTPDSVASGRSVRFTARQRYRDGRKAIVLQRKASIGVLSSEGKYFAPFLLYETGCLPIELSVELVGQDKRSKADKVIEFACGE